MEQTRGRVKQMNKVKLCVAGASVLATLVLAPAASAWAPAATAAIHPGVQTFTQGAQCTSNFIFTNGSTGYVGQAAHCSGTGAPTSAGSTVYTYGNSELRGGVTKLSPKQGIVVQQGGNGWSRDVYTVTPGIPGDSGSGFLDSSGKAIGVLSTVQLAPLAGSNGVGDLAREITYMHANANGANVAPGTQPFNPSLPAAILGPEDLRGPRTAGGQPPPAAPPPPPPPPGRGGGGGPGRPPPRP